MIKLKRKTAADTITTNDGIEHPDLICVLDQIIVRNIFDEVAQVRFNFYHSEALYEAGKQPIQPADFGIGQVTHVLTKDSSPSFKTMMDLLSFSGDEIGFSDDTAVANWMLAQEDPIARANGKTKAMNIDWEQIV